MKSIIVIGGGILGASTAYHLSKKNQQVYLIDRKNEGQATDAAAGIVCPWLSQRRNKAWYQLAKGGAKYYEYLIKMLEEDGEFNTGYKKVGALSIHTSEEKLDKMAERAFKRREDAPEIGNITRLGPVETKKMFPPLGEQYSSVHISGAARVNGRDLCKSLIRAAEKNGATILSGEAKLSVDHNKITAVEIKNEKIMADQIIITAGAWAAELLKPFGIELLVTSQKAQIVHLELQGYATEDWPVVMPPNNQYILSFDQNKIVVGATHENDKGYDLRKTAGGILEVLEKALTIAPGLEDAAFIETRVGFRPFTPGFLPVIGEIPSIKGLFFANGLGASGLTVGPYLGAELAKIVMNEQTEIDLSLYPVASAIKE